MRRGSGRRKGRDGTIRRCGARAGRATVHPSVPSSAGSGSVRRSGSGPALASAPARTGLMIEQSQMPADTADPVTFAGGVLDRYRHVCAFWNGPGEQDAVLDPFVKQGIDGGDRLLYLVDPPTSAAPVNRIRQLGYDPRELLERRSCEVRTWAETY